MERSDMAKKYPSGVFLPPDIMGDILSRLPAKFVARLRCVCKDWMSLTCDPCFLNAQHKRALLARHLSISSRLSVDGKIKFCDYNFEDMILKEWLVQIKFEDKNERHGLGLQLSNSVNGLVFMYSVHPHIRSYCYLLNPTTGESTTIQISRQTDWVCWHFGLGYDVSTGKYKLIRLYKLRYVGNWSCEVLTLGTTEWRHVGGVPNSLPRGLYELPESCPVPIFLNGAVHWNKRNYITDDEANKSDFMVNMLTFDIKDEKLGITTSSVTTRPDDHFHQTKFLEWRGHLCVMLMDRKHSGCKDDYLEIWMLKDRASGTWSKECSVAFPYSAWHTYVLPLADEKLLVRCKRRTYLHDIRSQTFIEMHIQSQTTFDEIYFDQIIPRVIIYRESLVSPRQVVSVISSKQQCGLKS